MFRSSMAARVAPLLLALVAAPADAAAPATWTQRLTADTPLSMQFSDVSASADGRLLLGGRTSDGRYLVAKIDPDSGTTDWSWSTRIDPDEFYDSIPSIAPLSDGGAVVAALGTIDSFEINPPSLLMRVDAQGVLRWSSRIESPALFGPVTELGTDRLVVSAGKSFFTSGGATSVFDAADGTMLWSRVSPSGGREYGSNVVGGDALYITSRIEGTFDDRRLHRLDTSDGHFLWSVPLSGSEVFARAGALYSISETGAPSRPAVTRHDPDDGSVVWQFVAPEAGTFWDFAFDATGHPLLAHGSGTVLLSRLDAASGQRTLDVAFQNLDAVNLDVSPSRIVVRGVSADEQQRETLIAVDAASGQQLWRREPTGSFAAVTSAGRIVLASSDGLQITGFGPVQPILQGLDAQGNVEWTRRPVDEEPTPEAVTVSLDDRTCAAFALRHDAIEHLHVRCHRDSDGMLLWEATRALLDGRDVDIGGIVATPDGRVVVTATQREQSGNSSFTAQVRAYDAATGAPQLSFSFGGTGSLTLGQLVADPAGNVYVVEHGDFYSPQQTQVAVTKYAPNGGAGWRRVLQTFFPEDPDPRLPTLVTATADGLVLYGPGLAGLTLFAAADGATAWTTPLLPASATTPRTTRLGGDLVVAGLSSASILADRIALASGTVVWSRQHAVATYAMNNVQAIATDGSNAIHLLGRQRAGADVRSRVLTLAAATGNVVNAGGGPVEPTTNLVLLSDAHIASATELWSIKRIFGAIPGHTSEGWLQYRLLRTDRASGNTIGEHIIGSRVDDDPVERVDTVSLLRTIGGNAFLTASTRSTVGRPVATELAHIDVPAFTNGDLAVSTSFGLLEGGAATLELPFSIAVTYTGTVNADGALVRARLPTGYRFASLQCVVTQGSCVIRAIDDLRAELDVAPGATATITGRIRGSELSRGEGPVLFAIGELPFRFNDTNLFNDVAGGTFSDVMFDDSFE